MMKILSITAASLFLFTACTETTSNKGTENSSTQTDSAATKAMQDEHTSENSLDWAGTYEGTIPCADCPGIKTTIVLNSDNTFQYDTEYLERKVKTTDKGTFTWEKNGSTVHLKGKETDNYLKVGENQLFLLDTEGNIITGTLADNYILKKK